jgi:PCI domain
VQEFGGMLREHQKAVLADGFTVLESAAVQHNIRAVSNIYANISLTQLATLLGLSEDAVEGLAAGMISEGRLAGHIDQARRPLGTHACLQRCVPPCCAHAGALAAMVESLAHLCYLCSC